MNPTFQQRAALIRGDLGIHSRIIEIGPSHKPLAPKRDGWRTTVVDYAPREVVAARFLNDPTSASLVEDVDYIWLGGHLTEVVPADLHGKFDGLIASHAIEHLPDFLGFLQAAEVLIRDSGAMGFAVPDKRYCFDFFKPITTTGDVIAAHSAQLKQHSGRTAFNDTAYSVLHAGTTGWGKVRLDKLSFVFNIGRAMGVMRRAEKAAAEQTYHDFHAWYFTPSSFELLILELGHLGLANWSVTSCETPYVAEFIVNLRKGREEFNSEQEVNARRMSLLKRTFNEVKVQIEMLQEEGCGAA